MSGTILGVGAAVGTQRISSAELEASLGLEPGWIAQRTGILDRPRAAPDQATSDLAVEAGALALAHAGIPAAEIRLLLLATSTPDHLLPPSAPLVAHRLGLRRAGAVDLAGACAGFLYALSLADAQLSRSGGYGLVIGANALSRRLNPKDPATAALFADGAGAVVIGPGEGALLAVELGADGADYETILIPAGGSRRPLTPEGLTNGEGLMRINRGPALFRRAVEQMTEAGLRALQTAGLTADKIDWWVPHQANQRIIVETGKRLGISSQRTVNIIAKHGNSSAATIPLALSYADGQGLLRRGQLLLLTAVGAGTVSAGMVLRW